MAENNYSPYLSDKYPLDDVKKLVICIVRTEWNSEIVDQLESGAVNTLTSLGIEKSNIQVHTVPGSFELPLGAKFVLASRMKADAIICLGCVIQGETKHDDYINHSVAVSLSHLNLVSQTPVIFGVVTANNHEQAVERSGGSHGNKGEESAIAALKMVSLKESLQSRDKKISF